MLWTLLDILWITLTLMVVSCLDWFCFYFFFHPGPISLCVCLCVYGSHRLCSPGVDNTQWLQSGYFDGRTEVRAFRNIAYFMHTNIKTFHFIVMQRVCEIVAVNREKKKRKKGKKMEYGYVHVYGHYFIYSYGFSFLFNVTNSSYSSTRSIFIIISDS